MNGLLTQKPGREPVAGETKLFTVGTRTGKSGKQYTKISNATADQGGTPYVIKSVRPTGFTDDHGNVSFNLEIEPSDGSQPREVAPQRAGNGGGSDERGQRIERQHSQHMALLHIAAKGSGFPDTDGLRALIDWYHRDVGRMPASPSAKADLPPEPEMDEEMMAQGDADGEESF